MKVLHVLDTLDPNKSIPRIAFKMARVFGGSSSFASDYPINPVIPDYETLSIGEALKRQNEFGVIHLHTAVYSIAFRRSAARCVHHFYGSSGFRMNRYAMRHEINERFMAKRFGLVVSCSEFLSRIYSDKYHRTSEVLYPGVDMQYSIDPQSPGYRYLFVGVLKARKRVPLLIQAMADLVKWNSVATLTIVGSGPDLPDLQRLVISLGLEDNVTFTGKVSDKSLISIYQNCDVYVSASEWEGFGMPLLEAMSFGKPLVVSDCEAHKEIIEYSHSGLSVEANPQEFAKSMERAAGSQSFRDNGLAFAREHSWQSFMDNLLHLIETRMVKL